MALRKICWVMRVYTKKSAFHSWKPAYQLNQPLAQLNPAKCASTQTRSGPYATIKITKRICLGRTECISVYAFV